MPTNHVSLLSALLVASALGCSSSTASKPASSVPAQPAASEEAPRSSEARFDAELSGVDYPFPVKRFEFESQRQRLQMAFMDVPAEGPERGVVLLLHGKNFQSSAWETTARRLAQESYRVIAPDQIGFGKSSKPPAYQFTFQALAENTRALLTSLGIARVAVVGHSMGGMLATRFALMYPEVASELVLVNPLGLEDWKTVVPYRSVDAWYERELAATPAKLRAYQREAYYGGAWRPEYEPYLEAAIGWLSHPDYPRVAWVSALTYDMIFTQPVLYEFPLVRVPTLLIVGTRDRTAIGKDAVSPDVAKTLGDYPVLAERAATAIPGARLELLSNVGHVPQVEAFDRFVTTLLGFLRR
jgi:pimeloyl-ACP methyl ester carboxylesterase